MGQINRASLRVKKSDLYIQKLLAAQRLALDSMIFIYLLEGNEKYFSLVETIFELLEEGKITAITSIITPLEVLSTPKLLGHPDQISLYARFFQQEKNLTVCQLDWAVMEIASSLRRNFNLRTPDAIQLATAKINNATIFLTNDDNYKKIIKLKDLPQIYFLSEIVRN